MLAQSELMLGRDDGAVGGSALSPITIMVPGVAVPKGRPKFTTVNGFARAITPSKTRRYEDLVRLEASRVMDELDLLPLEVALAVSIDVYLPIPKSLNKARTAAALRGWLRPITRPDCDNYAKVCDALNGVVWRDDSQVVELRVGKHYSDQPRLTVMVSLWRPEGLP